MALGSNLSALWILVANAWMQHPVGAEFNPETMRMELASFADLFFNPVAQVKFSHTAAACYVTGAMFVLSISAWYMLKGRDLAFAHRSFAIAAAFGLASVLSVIVLGDESGYEAGQVQKMKLAAIEAEWETEAPPAAFTLFGLPDREAQETRHAIKIPWVLGLIATRSIDEEVKGIKDLVAENEQRIRRGIRAYALLPRLRDGSASAEERAAFEAYKSDLGYALLLKRYTPAVVDASETQIRQAALDTVPDVATLFWAFRLMVACGFWMLLLFALAFFFSNRRGGLLGRRWLLRMAFWSLPLPWLAVEMGWVVAEYGRQPWSIGGILPTRLGVSSLAPADLYFSLGGFVLFYTLLLVAEMFLMLRYARLGPSSLHSGRYHFERAAPEG